jgi:hypothetical protein
LAMPPAITRNPAKQGVALGVSLEARQSCEKYTTEVASNRWVLCGARLGEIILS